ncbi:hypothetical protein A2U01_0094638, partial [Trifolium medium]|nr:hypothetical protein [Trifolium medium]
IRKKMLVEVARHGKKSNAHSSARRELCCKCSCEKRSS